MNFADLKKNRNDYFKNLTDKMQTLNSSVSKGSDDRFWELSRDKAGNGAALIRFLPGKDGSTPAVKYFAHEFQGNSGWMFENCPTTIGKPCYVCEQNSDLWNSGIEANKKLASYRKRKAKFVSNILVINDPDHPENNGKVFLFKYGPKIYEKIEQAMFPKEKEVTLGKKPQIVIDLWDGNNFKLQCAKSDGYIKYDSSEFMPSTPVADNDDRIKEIFEAQYDLQPFISEDQFKSNEELKQRFDKINGTPKTQPTSPTQSSKPKRSTTKPVEPDISDDDDNDLLGKLAAELDDDEDLPF